MNIEVIDEIMHLEYLNNKGDWTTNEVDPWKQSYIYYSPYEFSKIINNLLSKCDEYNKDGMPFKRNDKDVRLCISKVDVHTIYLEIDDLFC